MPNIPSSPAQIPDFLTLLKQQDEQRARRRDELANIVAQVPVTEDVLKEITWLAPRDRTVVLRSHPGLEIERKLQSLWSMRSIFDKTHIDLLAQLDRFHAFSLTEEMHLPIGRPQLESIKLSVNKELVAFSAAAGALVAFSRRLKEAIVIPEFEAQRAEIFDADEHRFVIALRNVICHQEFPDVSWQIKYGVERETDFVLSAEWLRHHGEHKGVHVRALAESYAARVRKFYDWYGPALEARAPEALADYRRMLKACMANASRTMHRLVFQQFLEKRIDPYDHLHKYLLPHQIEEALKMSTRSKEQVDFIIATVDDYGACDDELRRLVYRLFDVSE